MFIQVQCDNYKIFCVITLIQAGRDLGNHSENHKNMSRLSDEEKRETHEGTHESAGTDRL